MEVVNHRGAGRTLTVEPPDLVGHRVRVVEHAPGTPAELIRIALVSNGKSTDRDAVDLFDPGRPLVAPRHVVTRAGRDDLDLGVPREPLGHVARMELCATVDVRAVALDHDRELHDSEVSPPVPES